MAEARQQEESLTPAPADSGGRPECVVLVGLPGSGKSTFYRTRFGATHVHVSKDELPNVRNRDARQRELIERSLRNRQSVVVDNTNPTVADRAPLVALARAHGASVIAFFLDSTTRQAVARNQQREGRARVPRVAIFACARRLQPPTTDEGFDRVETVRALDGGRFEAGDGMKSPS